ncbi:hypothetical protein Lal_00044882 [Lupinus albus]|nr:hypothetical protein Lal_00044882 [Lupinus albus]
MGPMATGLGEIYQFELRGPAYTPMQLKRILQWTIAPKLKLTPGIADVNIYGGQMPTDEVRVSAEALRRYGVTFAQVYTALADNNAARGGAYIEHNDQQETIRGLGLAKGPEDIANIVVATGPGGVPVTLGTLGTVLEAPKVRLGAVTHDAEGETVVGIAMMRYGENASAVVEDVKKTIADLRKQLPPGIEIVPYYDRSALVDRTIHTVEHNLLEGAVLVIVVLLLLLGNLRAGLIVAAAIPLSMLMAFAGMRLLGLSGNLMSLGAIDFGLIVDGAVVMIENMLRARAEHPDRPAHDLIRDAAAEVARPVIFAVVIIIIVYVPILALEGVAGKMFAPMALTVILALGSSLIVTLILMPALAAIFLAGRVVAERETRLVHAVRGVYTPMLRWAERHALVTVLTVVTVFAGSCVVATRLGGEFLPKLSEGSIVITSEKLPGISLDASLATVTHIERVLKSFPEVKRIVSLTGSAEIPTDPMGVESTDSFISLTDPSTWTNADSQEGLVAAFDKRLREEVPGVAYSFSQPIQMRMDDLLEGVRGDVAISLYGDDLKVLKDTADSIVRVVSGIQGAADVKAEAQAGMPALSIQVDRSKAARYGINVSDVLDVVESIGGHTAGMVYGDDNSITDIVVRLDPADRSDIERIRTLPVGRPGKENGPAMTVPLSMVASVEVASGPAQISRERCLRPSEAAAPLRTPMERPVPELAGGNGPTVRGGAGGAGGDPRPPRHHVRRPPPCRPDLPERADGRHGRHPRPRFARDAVLDLGGDRLYRDLRHRDPERRGTDELHPRPRRLRARSAGGGYPGGRDAPAPGDDDGPRRGFGLPADGPLDQCRGRGAAPARHRGDRRADLRHAADPCGPAGDLSAGRHIAPTFQQCANQQIAGAAAFKAPQRVQERTGRASGSVSADCNGYRLHAGDRFGRESGGDPGGRHGSRPCQNAGNGLCAGVPPHSCENRLSIAWSDLLWSSGGPFELEALLDGFSAPQ